MKIPNLLLSQHSTFGVSGIKNRTTLGTCKTRNGILRTGNGIIFGLWILGT